MSDKQNYAIWRPEYDGHAPPNWREGMSYEVGSYLQKPFAPVNWAAGLPYQVPREAVEGPTAGQKIIGALEEAIAMVRAASPETLQKHGITLAPEKDWAVELWVDLLTAMGRPTWAEQVLKNDLDECDKAAIAFIRERVVLKEGV